MADVFNSEWLPKGSANASLKGFALDNRYAAFAATTKRGEAEVAKADRPQPRRGAPAAAKLRSRQIAIAILGETIRFRA